MNKQFQINCSPGTFKRMQDDETYRTQIFDQVMREKHADIEEVVFTSAPNEDPGTISQATGEPVTAQDSSEDAMFTPIQRGESPKLVWLEAPTKLLLFLLQELQPKVGKSVHVKSKAKMWSIIEERMAFEGYNFSCAQIENKFRTLERQYKKTMLHNKRTGSNRQMCPYQSELSEILGSKHSVNPVYTLDNTSSDQMELTESASDLDQTLPDDVPSCSHSKRKTTGQRNKLQDTLNKIEANQEAFNEKILNYLEAKEQRAKKKKKERNERRILQKKSKLLEKLINRQN